MRINYSHLKTLDSKNIHKNKLTPQLVFTTMVQTTIIKHQSDQESNITTKVPKLKLLGYPNLEFIIP